MTHQALTYSVSITCRIMRGPAISFTFFREPSQSLLYRYARAAEPHLYPEMTSHDASSKVKYNSCTRLPVLSENKTAPIRYKRYASTVASSAPSGRCDKFCASHVTRRLLPLATSAGGQTPNNLWTFSCQLSSWRPTVHMACPSMGSRVSTTTSSKVTIASPRGRWKVWVSWRHRFTKVVTSARSTLPYAMRWNSYNLAR